MMKEGKVKQDIFQDDLAPHQRCEDPSLQKTVTYEYMDKCMRGTQSNRPYFYHWVWMAGWMDGGSQVEMKVELKVVDQMM